MLHNKFIFNYVLYAENVAQFLSDEFYGLDEDNENANSRRSREKRNQRRGRLTRRFVLLLLIARLAEQRQKTYAVGDKMPMTQ